MSSADLAKASLATKAFIVHFSLAIVNSFFLIVVICNY